jgi:ABC-type spermidine/putrescine transport system permease subunit I
MVRAKLKTPEGRKFLLALLVVFMIAAAGVGRATIVGVIEQYNIPLSEWTTSMYVLQSAMICVYSLVFTVLLAIPLGIYFRVTAKSIKSPYCYTKAILRVGFFYVIIFINDIYSHFYDALFRPHDCSTESRRR